MMGRQSSDEGSFPRNIGPLGNYTIPLPLLLLLNIFKVKSD
jgi:hypothetical protein